VLIANCSAKADLLHATEHTGCNVGTARLVAEVFRDLFFAPVGSRETRLDRYQRNRGPPSQMITLLSMDGPNAQVTFARPWTLDSHISASRRPLPSRQIAVLLSL
jgi:hypothetical protein